MNLQKLKVLLSSSESKHILKALIEIRTKVMKSRAGLDEMLADNFLFELVNLLDRSNPKIIDITLSILANLLQDEVARQQIRSSGGLSKLLNIVQNIEDANILCRAWRAVANASQDAKNIKLLHQLGLATHLCQALANQPDTHSQVVLVRCARIAGDSDRHRGYLAREGVLDEVVNIMQEDISNKQDLCKAVVKCLAKLSHGAKLEESEKILPGVEVLVKLASEGLKDISDNCLGALVNLSQHDQLRPSLGNADVVDILVKRFHSCDKNSQLKNSVMTALCLYCRESVNRVKLREAGGCKLFVEVLSSKEEEMMNLQDIVLNSLLQFIYDNHSLNVLMDQGLIPSLIQMLQEYSDSFNEDHKCDLVDTTVEEYIAGVNDAEQSDVIIGSDTEIKAVDRNENNEDTPLDDNKSTIDDNDEVTSAANDDDDNDEEQSVSKSGPVFRITSPSYQAVQYELEQFMQLRTNMELNTSGSGSPRWPLSNSSVCSGGPSSPQSPPSSPPEWIPLSPSSSICQSPDRSPPRLFCGFSPTSSDTDQSPRYSCPSPESTTDRYSPLLYSPSSQPISPEEPSYSPQEPSYSPIENFSDEEGEATKDDEYMKQEVNESVKSLHEVKLESSNDQSSNLVKNDHPIPSTSGEPKLYEPWTKRTIKIQRTHTYLGQTFTLPPRTRSPSPPSASPAKRPKLSTSPLYKYSPSPLPSPKSSTVHPFRQLPSTPVSSGPPQKVKKPFSRISSIMQILARLCQAERPHADLTSAKTISTIFTYMSLVPSGVEKSGKILNRLSTNLYCLFPFLLSRHYSYLTLVLEDLNQSPMELGCNKCPGGFHDVQKIIQAVGHNLTLLAETGYGEGEICHRLVHPLASKEDKQAITMSAALLVRQRKMLRNILINHDSLDLLLDILEAANADKEDPYLPTSLFTQAVLSVSHLAGHLGVVSPSLTLPEMITGHCYREDSTAEDNITLVTDDGREVAANKEILSSACPVFAAMFSGSFSESGQSSIPIPHTSFSAVSCLIHYLYSCLLCKHYSDLSIPTLLELVSLSDQYLLPDLNQAVSHCIIKRFVSGPHLVELYRLALQKKYPVQCGGITATLAQATLCTLLVGDMSTKDRVGLVMKLVSSDLAGDFLDDVGKMLREKLLERVLNNVK